MNIPAEEIDAIRRNHPLENYLPTRGLELRKSGQELVCCCPFHQDKSPSFSVNVTKQVWTCRAGCGGGDVIEFVRKIDGLNFVGAVEKLAGRSFVDGAEHQAGRPVAKSPAPSTPTPAKRQPPLPPPECHYSYTDADGKEVFQALRYRLEDGSKTFRQRRRGEDGKWLWNLDGIETPVYRLPEVVAAGVVWVVEGEKDADTVAGFGLTATCNPMGAEKWYEHHSRLLAGKEVILCGDNDEAGERHMAAAEKSLAKHVRFTKRIRVPEPHKDLSEFIAAAATPEAGMLALMELAQAAPELYRGIELPFQSLEELEADYALTVSREETASVDLARWLPSFRGVVRPLVPGELCTILAATGAGKTAILQNIALAVAPLPVLLFELELPGSLTFERFVALATGETGESVYKSFQQPDASRRPDWRKTRRCHRVYTCSRSNLSVSQMTRFVNYSHLKIGARPAVVMVDYFGLLSADGRSRYERMSAAAEELKNMAKATNTVVIATSQIGRDERATSDGEVFLHDAKDSGSIENSSGLVLGAWRDPGDLTNARLFLKVLKNTKGQPGRKIECRCDDTLRIAEITRSYPRLAA